MKHRPESHLQTSKSHIIRGFIFRRRNSSIRVKCNCLLHRLLGASKFNNFCAELHHLLHKLIIAVNRLVSDPEIVSRSIQTYPALEICDLIVVEVADSLDTDSEAENGRETTSGK